MLFNNTDQIKEYFVANTVDFDKLKPYIKQATTKYIKPYLGESLLSKLDSYAQNGSSTTTKMDNLLDITRQALANFTHLIASPFLNVVIDNNGFAIISNQNLAPASKERVESFKQACMDTGYDALEQLLIFLEKNVNYFPEWEDSEAYSDQTDYYIITAIDFNRYVNINESRLKFIELRPIMKRIEVEKIEATISKDLSDEIKASLLAGDISEYNNELLPFIKKAIAFLSAGELLDEKYTPKGELFLSLLGQYIYDNIAKYPIFKSSDTYDAEREDGKQYDNPTDSTMYVSP